MEQEFIQMSSNSNDLREKIAKIMVDYGVDFYEGNLMHRTEQRLALIEDFQNDILELLADRENRARDNLLTDLENFKNEVLESRGIKNPTYIGKKELQEWIDNRKVALSPTKSDGGAE